MDNSKLIAKIQQLDKWIEEEYLPQLEKESSKEKEIKKAKDVLYINKKALHRLGYRKPRIKTNSKPNPNAFKKVEHTGEVKYDNSDANPEAFKKAPLKIVKEKEIINDAPKDAFKKKELPKTAAKVDKSGAKKSRLSKADKEQVTKLAKEEGYSVDEISEQLWFSEKAIRKALGLKEPKKPKVLLGDNLNDDLDTFKKEVKDSKE